ncbi:MAG: sigma 54-interacting transcriptional regulator, partial [Candidatus Margulisbacteria bacterium]|nr:sigma 54-interacting transcriptional regulator [Candidatus Margulisiibacteriota bacterium]
ISEEGGEVQKNASTKAPELIGQAELSKALDKIKKAGRVLIIGEPGTEKELVAQLIHAKSDRRLSPFKTLALAPDMPANKIKALLFGWGKGGSTVALEAKSGLLEEVKDGTLFIDNAEYLPAEISTLLSEREFTRSGSSTSIPIDARLIGGSSARLEFFAESSITLPPLRARSSDLPLLINHYLEIYNSRYGREIKVIPAAMEALTNYSWPGNTCQLESLIQRLILSCPAGEITLAALPFDLLMETTDNAGADYFEAFEKKYIRAALEHSGRDKEKAANLLGINPILLEAKI